MRITSVNKLSVLVGLLYNLTTDASIGRSCEVSDWGYFVVDNAEQNRFLKPLNVVLCINILSGPVRLQRKQEAKSRVLVARL